MHASGVPIFILLLRLQLKLTLSVCIVPNYSPAALNLALYWIVPVHALLPPLAPQPPAADPSLRAGVPVSSCINTDAHSAPASSDFPILERQNHILDWKTIKS